MASLLELRKTSDAAISRLATERAAELALRAVAQAETSLPADSLVTVHVRMTALAALTCIGQTPELMASPDAPQRMVALMTAAWEDDARMLALSRCNLEALGKRWRAGTLAAPSETDILYFSRIPGTDAHGVGARMSAFAACDAMISWPMAAQDAAALRDARDAISALLDADASGKLFPPLPPGGVRGKNTENPVVAVLSLAGVLLIRLQMPLYNRTVPQCARLRRVLGLSRAQNDALAALRERMLTEAYGEGLAGIARSLQANYAGMREMGDTRAASAAAAVAKYGLQRCSLPACAAQEPAARSYKKYSRCGQAYYCCAAHQQEDWRRHKHEDGCKKPEADAAPSA